MGSNYFFSSLLESRIAAHRARRHCGYTSARLPVSLIFIGSFPARDEAFAAERRIKGWSRAKKLALPLGKWDVVAQLAAVRPPDRQAILPR